LWIRVPGLLFTSSLSYAGMMYANLQGPQLWAGLFSAIMNAWNALFFAKRVIVSQALSSSSFQ
jgi:hypothetical protein